MEQDILEYRAIPLFFSRAEQFQEGEEEGEGKFLSARR